MSVFIIGAHYSSKNNDKLCTSITRFRVVLGKMSHAVLMVNGFKMSSKTYAGNSFRMASYLYLSSGMFQVMFMQGWKKSKTSATVCAH